MALVKVEQGVLGLERWGYIMFILSLFSGFFTFLRPFTVGIRLLAALFLTASNVVFVINEVVREASDDDKLKQMQRTIDRLKREKKMWEVEKQKLMEQVTIQKLKEQETTEKNTCDEEEKQKLNKEQEDEEITLKEWYTDEINYKWSKIEEEFKDLKEKHELKMDNLLKEVSRLVEEFEVYGNKVNEKLEVYENKVNEELNHDQSERNGLKYLNEQYKDLLNKQQYFMSMITDQYYHTGNGNGSSEGSSFSHVPKIFDEVY